MTVPVQPPPPRWFNAPDILSGKVRLDAYPLSFVVVGTLGALGRRALESTMAAVELLESRGWRVVNFEEGGRTAFLRREHRPMPVDRPPPGYPGHY